MISDLEVFFAHHEVAWCNAEANKSMSDHSSAIESMHLIPLYRVAEAEIRLRQLRMDALNFHSAIHPAKSAIKRASRQLLATWNKITKDASVAKLMEQRES